MDKQTIHEITTNLIGLKQYEWAKIKQVVDMTFSSKAAKVELDDSSELNRNLEVEFNLRRFGEK